MIDPIKARGAFELRLTMGVNRNGRACHRNVYLRDTPRNNVRNTGMEDDSGVCDDDPSKADAPLIA